VCVCVCVCVQLEPLKFRLLSQRLENDIQHEQSDISQLERALARNLKLVHARKRQLEIKRSRRIPDDA